MAGAGKRIFGSNPQQDRPSAPALLHEPECAGEAQQRGASPSWKGAKRGRTTRPCHDLSSLSGEVEAVARGDRSMQLCMLFFNEVGSRRVLWGAEILSHHAATS